MRNIFQATRVFKINIEKHKKKAYSILIKINQKKKNKQQQSNACHRASDKLKIKQSTTTKQDANSGLI